MKKPMSEKTLKMKSVIDVLFPNTLKAIDEGNCPVCHQAIVGFRNDISRREYEISGMCQECQNSFFGVD